MRILFINGEVPFPPVGGGMTRTFHLLRALSTRHEVVLAGFSHGIPREYPQFPIRVVDVPWENPPLYQAMQSTKSREADRAFATLDHEIPAPWLFSYYDTPRMRETLGELVRSRFDLIVLGDVNMAIFLTLLPPDVPCVMEFNNVYSRMARQAADTAGATNTRAQFEAQRTLRFERDAVARCARCLVCSADDQTAVRELLGVSDPEIIPNGVDTEYHQPSAEAPEPRTILFTGTMSYPPNIEAVNRFVCRILPKIRAEISGVRFEIVGFKPAKEVEQLASSDVIVTGAVPDARPYFRRAIVFVVPLTSGGGTRLKVLDAAANGKAIVSTNFGFEGISFEPGRDLLAADSDDDFAAAVVDVIRDETKRRSLEQHARQVALRYNWREIEAAFLRVIDSLQSNAAQPAQLGGPARVKVRQARAAAVRADETPPRTTASRAARVRGDGPTP